MAQEFWIPRKYTDHLNGLGHCIKIMVPDHCPRCGDHIDIVYSGSEKINSSISHGPCDALDRYEAFWNMRIITPTHTSKYVNVCPCGIHPSRCDYHKDQ